MRVGTYNCVLNKGENWQIAFSVSTEIMSQDKAFQAQAASIISNLAEKALSMFVQGFKSQDWSDGPSNIKQESYRAPVLTRVIHTQDITLLFKAKVTAPSKSGLDAICAHTSQVLEEYNSLFTRKLPLIVEGIQKAIAEDAAKKKPAVQKRFVFGLEVIEEESSSDI